MRYLTLARAAKSQLAVEQPLTESAGKIKSHTHQMERPTNWGKSVTKETLHCCEGFEPHIQASCTRGSKNGLAESQGNLALKASGVWNYRTSTGLEERVLEGTKEILCSPTPRRQGAVTPWKTEPELPASAGGSPTSVCWQGLISGTEALAAALLEDPPRV